MKKSIIFSALLSISYVNTAQEPSEQQSGLLYKVVPNVKKLVRNAVTKVGNILQPADDAVSVPVEEDYDLVAHVSAASIQDLASIINRLNTTVIDYNKRLTSTLATSHNTVQELSSQLESLRSELQHKDKQIKDLKKSYRSLSSARSGSDKAPTEHTVFNEEEPTESENPFSSTYKTTYHAALQAKQQLEQELRKLEAQNNELIQRVHDISRQADRSQQSQQMLQSNLLDMQMQREEDEAVCSSILAETQENYRQLGLQYEVCMQEKSLTLAILETVLRQAAQDRDFNKEFAQEVLQALNFSDNQIATLNSLLFPSATSYIDATGEEVFEG